MSKGRFGKGWHKDAFNPKDHPAMRLFGARSAAPLPPAASLDQFVDAIRDQGQAGACFAFATARAIHVRMAARGTPIAYPSEDCIYKVGRALMRQAAGDPPSTPLTDSGTVPASGMQGIKEWGVPSAADFPYDADNVNEEPNLDELEGASLFKVPGWYRVDNDAGTRIAAIQQALVNFYPPTMGILVDQDFENWDPAKGPILSINTDGEKAFDPIEGGHMLPITSYFTDPAHGLILRGPNSWGPSWGKSGFDEIAASALTDAVLQASNSNPADLFVITVQPT
jgi:hypothetical protein